MGRILNYTDEDKQTFVARLTNEKAADVAKDVDVHVTSLYHWRKQFATTKNGNSATNGNGNGHRTLRPAIATDSPFSVLTTMEQAWKDAMQQAQESRNKFIHESLALGWTTAEIGTKIGISASRVSQIVREEQDNG